MGNPTIDAWRRAGENRDARAVAACLAPDAELVSPLTAAFRFHGVAQITDVLAAAFEVIHEIRYHTETSNGDTWALFYHGRTKREQFEEAQLIRLNSEGLIRELTLFGRPLPALTDVMAGIGPRLLHRQRQPALARIVGVATAPLNFMTRVGERTLLPKADPNRALTFGTLDVMKLLLPNSIDLELTVPGQVNSFVYDVSAPIPPEHTDAEALVVWGNPAGQLADAAHRLERLRWVQTLAAGPDAVLAAGFQSDIVITGGTGLHDLTVTEHTLALTLAAARRLNLLARAQVGHRWAGELGGLQPVREEGIFRTLRDARVTIWGFGGIAACLAPHLTALGARVTGVARTSGERHGYPVVTAGDFPQLLPETDVLIMILPATAETERALDARLLALLPRHAWLINVGRGTTVDETALLAALRSGRLAGAALDVFETEPLPAHSGLWDEPSVIITPHAAGGRPLGAAKRISENLHALLSGDPLRHVVSR